MLKRVIKIVLIVALIALVAIQFIRPDKNTGGYESVALFERETTPSAEVALILKETCYDCHSDQTQYPWYSEIAPFSLWLDEHIEHGKEHFNVSAWSTYSIKKKEHKLEELVEMVEDGEMPLESYAIIHGGLSDEEKKLLLQWAGVARLKYKHQLEVSTNK
ncbi:heme-binding domain-containing protein [Aequorivita vladivostokensis]|uniref:Cytochrome C n=1 Tax=Aequorivita vladivostokensis TaxID=171194 RepID=A0ABR5DFK9_9FLAO|nr:heme-binding domain-containing protein [Aequorivita vladivostokensis]MAB58599.1 cytochrome C [Aequorivita sp.]HAB27612.1 cytochrome C [Xanthomarina gelatinilytica]KJJ37566.1 cytochrome C [Aequorivita vladivostokensis]MAO48649.1 cytochrome C [Aequorivita sp.]MBF31712.1 cytochrome C [Aequorivita sp.]|tara:strand:+ start:54296 stop:54778 length:483 start_codon:yes stop_codon:yes gene_type:complete